jgi:hypothetical protein
VHIHNSYFPIYPASCSYRLDGACRMITIMHLIGTPVAYLI